MEYYAAERKKELLPFVTAWMELEKIMPSWLRQLVKDKHVCDLTYKRTLMKKLANKRNRARGMET